mgnify:FL=1
MLKFKKHFCFERWPRGVMRRIANMLYNSYVEGLNPLFPSIFDKFINLSMEQLQKVNQDVQSLGLGFHLGSFPNNLKMKEETTKITIS